MIPGRIRGNQARWLWKKNIEKEKQKEVAATSGKETQPIVDKRGRGVTFVVLTTACKIAPSMES